jgi:peptide/nickel transport system permease protein
MSNLDPSARIGAQLVEGLRSTSSLSHAEARERVLGLLRRVGLVEAERVFNSYPHEISGGMAQRVLIAGAVASRPKILIADEPTTALDVTVQAEILDLLRDLQSELDMGVLLVTHNLGVVADLCDRVVVMRSGEVVETGDVREIFHHPRHSYTQMLLGSILDEDQVRSDPAVQPQGVK